MNETPSGALRIAVFDVDRTLVRGTSAEVQLVRFLRRKRLFPSANLFRAVFWIPRLIPGGIKEAFLRNKFYLYGLDARFVRSLLPEFFERQLKPLLSPKMVSSLNRFKSEGFTVLLISGTLDFVLDFLIQTLDADGGVGTHVEIRDGKFTGRVYGVYPFSRDKVTALVQVLDGRCVDWKASYGFADSWADVRFLSLFGHPVAVNPDWVLRRKALRQGWVVEYDSPKQGFRR